VVSESTTDRRCAELRRGRILVLGVLAALAVALGLHPDAISSAQAAEPPVVPTPRADCGPGSRPETGIQGRVSPQDHASGRAAKGFTCNTELVGSYRKPNAIGTVGGFKVERYVDASGHDCAYYDTTLMFPTNVLDTEGGVNVLDMADPTKPVLTDRLVTPAMDSPHESLVLSQKRGVLAAVAGNLTTNVGQIDLYDVSQDCRHPVLKSSTPVGFLGHESGMAPDGRTFYSASPSSKTLVAVDISNLTVPVPIWFGNYDSHGLSISDDGNRAYVAGVGSGLNILDTSQVQARVPNPTVRLIARLTWNTMSIPQNAIPVTIKGHPYLVEIDEFGGQSKVGAARIIDIADEAHPRVVSNLRLQVHQPENFAAQANDNGAQNPVQGYAGHYCNVPTRVDPGIVACSMILSGLRVFDIRDPLKPREIAYFNAPEDPRIIPPAGIVPSESNWAMSSPSFVPRRGEIWYSDGLSGFYAVRATNGVWPFGSGAGAGTCLARRSPIGPRNIGRVRLGYTRSRLLRVPVKLVRKTRRSYRFCVKKSSGRVSAVFSGRGRAVIVATTARGHGNRGVRPGVSVRALRRAYSRRRALGRGLYRANRKSTRVIGVRKGRVRYIAVVDGRLLRRPRTLQRYLRFAGL
jgi:LVIVD repeat-containing protein